MISSKIKIVFSLLAFDFILIMLGVFLPNFFRAVLFNIAGPVIFLIEWGILILLGIALIVLAIKDVKENNLRRSFLMTGIASVGFPVCVLLHNLVCGLLSLVFNKEIEEPVFFILAIIVCPIVFSTGAIKSIILIFKQKKVESNFLK